MRLIDADALAMHMADWQLSACSDQCDTIEEAIDAVTSAPTIDAVPATIEGTLGYLHKVGWMQEHDRIMTEDAVPVVRCKDCFLYGKCKAAEWYGENGNGYCSVGDRKKDDE